MKTALGTDVAHALGPAVFEDFYRSQADRVHRALAVTLGDPHLAREATDEAMARVCARWPRVSELDNPGGWVYRVEVRVRVAARRRRRVAGGSLLSVLAAAAAVGVPYAVLRPSAPPVARPATAARPRRPRRPSRPSRRSPCS